MNRCFQCGQSFTEDTQGEARLGEHLKKHGVNVMSALIAERKINQKLTALNVQLSKRVKELEVRLRIVAP